MIIEIVEAAGAVLRFLLTSAVFWWLYWSGRYEWLLFAACGLAFVEAFRDWLAGWYEALREEHERNVIRRFDARFYRPRGDGE